MRTLIANRATEHTAGSPAPTSTNAPTLAHTIACQGQPSQPAPPDLPGAIVLWDPQDGTELFVATFPGPALTAVSSPQPSSINEVGRSQLVSPDRTSLAFTEEDVGPDGFSTGTPRLRVIDATGSDVVPSLSDSQFGVVISWTADGRVILQDAAPADGSMMVVDPQDGTYERLPPALANPGPYDSDFWWEGIPYVVYDPSLTRALYSSYPNLVLWDAALALPLATLNIYGTNWIPPWAPDSSGVLVKQQAPGGQYREDLFLLSREGNLTPLTDLAQLYDTPYIIVSDARWSPDASKIALWVATEGVSEPHTNRFFVLDLATLHLTDFCVTDDGYSQPQWSPDGRYVALHEGIVIDTRTLKAYSSGLPGTPLGWIQSVSAPTQ